MIEPFEQVDDFLGAMSTMPRLLAHLSHLTTMSCTMLQIVQTRLTI